MRGQRAVHCYRVQWKPGDQAVAYIVPAEHNESLVHASAELGHFTQYAFVIAVVLCSCGKAVLNHESVFGLEVCPGMFEQPIKYADEFSIGRFLHAVHHVYELDVGVVHSLNTQDKSVIIPFDESHWTVPVVSYF